MSLIKVLPAWLHAIADYAVGIALIAVALVAADSGKALAAGVVIGSVVLVVSLLTRYPLGLIKVLPFKVHSAGDYLAAALLLVSPFALGFRSSEVGISLFYIGAGIAVLAVSLITNYQYGPAAAPAPPVRWVEEQHDETVAQSLAPAVARTGSARPRPLRAADH